MSFSTCGRLVNGWSDCSSPMMSVVLKGVPTEVFPVNYWITRTVLLINDFTQVHSYWHSEPCLDLCLFHGSPFWILVRTSPHETFDNENKNFAQNQQLWALFQAGVTCSPGRGPAIPGIDRFIIMLCFLHLLHTVEIKWDHSCRIVVLLGSQALQLPNM